MHYDPERERDLYDGQFKLTDFEATTARYFAGGDKPDKKTIKKAVEKCKFWNKQRKDRGLKPW